MKLPNELRQSLMSKLGVRRAQLYERIKRTANKLSLSSAEATLVLALQHHINLSKFKIASDLVDRLRPLATSQHSAPPPAPHKTARRLVQMRSVKPAGADSLLLPARIIAEANEMVPTYQKLYLLENSIRHFLGRVMEQAYGAGWWSGHVTSDVGKKATTRMSEEKRNAWHQRRGRNPIDYLDLAELPAIVRVNIDKFIPEFLPDLNWFEVFVAEVYASRCVVCHMNPLEANNIRSVEVRYNQWKRLIEERESKFSIIPQSKTPLPPDGTP